MAVKVVRSRPHQVLVRLSSDEHDLLIAAAQTQKNGVTVATLLRETAIKKFQKLRKI